MMMGAATSREANTICKILNDFSVASKISINSGKSKILFFNTPEAIQLHISRIRGYPWSSLPSKYLGIPLIDKYT
jgi:hypothetical protein